MGIKRYPLPSGMERDYWYPLPSLAGKGIIGIRCPHRQGMGMHSHNWQRVSHWYCCSTSSISQSSATSGSLATGTGGVVGLAAEGVDGGVDEVGIPGTLVSPGRGNGTGFTDAGMHG